MQIMPWVGSKRLLAPQIIPLIPNHQTYVEPFCGCCHVLFAKARGISKAEAINDLNGDIVNLFVQVRDNLQELLQYWAWLISAERLYKDYLVRLKAQDWRNPQERAFMFWYVVKHSFRGIYGAGWSHYKDRPAPGVVFDDFEQIHRRLQGVYISNKSAVDAIKSWDSPGTLFYIDPPYQMPDKKGDGLYQKNLNRSGHAQLRQALGSIEGTFLLSHTDTLGIRHQYQGMHFQTLQTNHSLSGQKHVTEVLISNRPIKPADTGHPSLF